MALIKCPECSNEISEKAKECPHCGCPNNQIRCPECSVIINDMIAKCPQCGYPFKRSQPKVISTQSVQNVASNSNIISGKGCLAIIGVFLVIICLIITFGHPGIKVFGVSALVIGMLGMLLIKEFGKG